MIEFVLGRSASGKTTYLYQMASRTVKNGGQVCFIVPEQESMATERLIQQKYGENVEVLSFHRLCDILMRLYGGGAKARLGDVAKIGILFRAVEAVCPHLHFYRKSAGSIRFYEKLMPVMDDFSAYKADSEAILKIITDPILREKYHDLFLIYDSYKALMATDYRDSFDDLDLAAKLLSEHPYFEGKTVLVDGFSGFTEQEYKILEFAFLKAEHCYMALTADENDSRLFAPVLSHLKRFTALAESYGLQYQKKVLEDNYRFESSDLKLLEKYLFSVRRPKEKQPSYGGIRIFSAANPEAEVKAVAADIRERVLSGKCRYKDIAVVSNVQDNYTHLVESVFAELDIPVHTDKRLDVLSKPLFALILHALDAVEYNYRFEDMFSMAKTYLCGLDFEQVARLENYVFMWNIRGAKWEYEWTQSPFGLEDGDAEEKKALLSELNEYRSLLITTLTEFKEDTRTGKATDLLSAVWRLAENLKVAETLKHFAETSASIEEGEDWTHQLDLLIELIDQMALVLGDAVITRKKLHDIMEICLRSFSFGKIPAYMDQVYFSDMVRSRVGEVKHMYVLGAGHGSFPAGVNGGSMITDRDIRCLMAQNIRLSKDSTAITLEQQLCIYRTLCSASHSITFYYPNFSASGEPLLPSALLGRISDKLLDIKASDVIACPTHPKDILEILSSLPADHEKRGQYADYIREKFGIELSSLCPKTAEDERLPREVVEALYEKQTAPHELSASQSRMECFVGCPFSFFLKYGLKISETEPVSFAANYIGDFVHRGMELLIGAVRRSGNIDEWTDEAVSVFVEDMAQTYYDEKLSDMNSPRFNHLFARIRRTLYLTGLSALDELRQSKFFPCLEEYHFEKKLPLSDGWIAGVNGYIDRVDMQEESGYIKIVDYKTGDKSFSLEKIYNGYQLQLPLYTKMLLDEQRFKNCRVAGMEYFLAGVPNFAQNTEDSSESHIRGVLSSAFKRHGLFLAEKDVMDQLDGSPKTEFANVSIKKDGTFSANSSVATAEQMEALCDFAEQKTVEIMEDMASGNVAVCPVKQGENACQYCDYIGICRFEYGKNKVRSYKKINNEEFFKAIGEGEE